MMKSQGLTTPTMLKRNEHSQDDTLFPDEEQELSRVDIAWLASTLEAFCRAVRNDPRRRRLALIREQSCSSMKELIDLYEEEAECDRLIELLNKLAGFYSSSSRKPKGA